MSERHLPEESQRTLSVGQHLVWFCVFRGSLGGFNPPLYIAPSTSPTLHSPLHAVSVHLTSIY